MCGTYSGIQLLEHEEVLFNYYEKVNSQEAATTKGNMALENLEKEMRDLQLAINEEKRQIDLKKKEVPLNKKLEGEITMLQIEVGKVYQDTCKPTHSYTTLRTLTDISRSLLKSELLHKLPVIIS